MTLKNVTLDDKYDLTQSRVFVTGYQALIRALPDAAGARPARRAQHRGLRVGLPRLAARRARPAVHARKERARAPQRPVPVRPQRGPRRDRDLGHAAGRAARRGQIRWRVRHVVRQGAGRRPHRRRVPPRQFRRLLEERRRARPDGRRPHGGILHHRAPVRVPFRRRDDADPESGGRAGIHRLRALRLGDVALLRLVGGAQMHARDRGVDRRGRSRARQPEDRHSGRREFKMPPGGLNIRLVDGILDMEARLHDYKRDAMLAFVRANKINKIITSGGPQRQDRHHHGRQELPRRAPGVRSSSASTR